MLQGLDIDACEAQLRALVAAILAEAKRQGASAAEVAAAQDAGLSVQVRKGALETVEFTQDRGFGITVYAGFRKGAASTSDRRPAAIRETVAKALDIARHTGEDPCNGLADAALMPARAPDLDLFHPRPLDTRAAAAAALACEAAGLASDQRMVNSEGAQASARQSCQVYGNSQGFIGSRRTTSHGLSCALIAEDGNGMQRDFWYSLARDPQDLEAPEQVGRTAARRALARLSPERVATGVHPVLFSPQMAGTLAGHLLAALSGGAQYRKASFLLDSLGEQVASDHLAAREQPLLPKRIGSAAFDGDGVATREQAFLEAGAVRSYLLSCYSARKLGMETTGNAGGPRNLALSGRTLNFQGLLREMSRGLYVTELMGQGVNGVNGDYSRGASGFWVEGGELRQPVHELTIASNLKDMLMNIVALGDDPDERSNLRAPSILIGAMTVAGEGG